MIKSQVYAIGILMMLVSMLITSTASAKNQEDATIMTTVYHEPNLEDAKQWWDDLPKKWTMIGWKEHISRFNVLYDGTLVNYFSFDKGPQSPVLTKAAIQEPYAQFAFIPASSIDGVPTLTENSRQDYGEVVQGWNDSNTPVLWSEWAWHGYLLRKQVFAHVPGGKELQRGDEPLFAWVRLSVHYACSSLPLEQNIGFGVRINAYSVNYNMELRHNLNYAHAQPEDLKYAHVLKSEPENYTAGQAFKILEPDGRIRMALAPGEDCKAVFKAGAPSERDSTLHISLIPKQGAYVDLLIPMLPTDREIFDKELAIGYDGALKEAETFWSKVPETAATFDVPEDSINQAIRRNLQFDQVTSEKDPATGETYVLTGALGYGLATWGTPVSIAMAELLDPMGYHSLVEKYLKAFKDAQGTVAAPGDSFKPHPGYLGVPPRNKIVNWLPDHGAILWVMAEHGLLTDDPAYIAEYTPVIVKACEWIKYARGIKGHGGVEGVMPPAGASDDESRIQSCWTDGWIYKGLSTAVRFMKKTNNPRAAEFEAEAKNYRETFAKAFRTKALSASKWTDDQGKEHTLVPFAFSKEQDWQFRHLFYLDTGPMHLVFAGLMEADDPLMKDAIAWYREGPPTKLYRPYGDLSHVPSLRHEMSSWEACYSWNVFHNWQLGDRKHFIEGLYSQFAGAMSQQTYSVCESRGGVCANIFWLPAVYLARLAVIDDQIKENELHLLRLCPLAWLRTDRESKFLNMPTEFGPVSLRMKLDAKGSSLQVSFSGKLTSQPGRIVLHIPPVEGVKSITLNGKSVKWDGKAEQVVVEH